MHRCIDNIITENRTSFDSCSGDIEWTNDDFVKARNLIQRLYQQRAKIAEDNSILKLEGVSKAVQEAILDCYELRKEEIQQAVIKKSWLQNGAENLVENIDWKVKWIMGSSKMASLREPILQLNLNCVGEKSIDFEMDLGKVDALINELEKVIKGN